MKKKYSIAIFVLTGMCILWLFYYFYRVNPIYLTMNKSNGQIEFVFSMEQEKIVGWENQNIVHFFFPSYIKKSQILMEEGYSLLINGELSNQLIYNENCILEIRDSNGDIIWNGVVCFHHSQNVYTMYVNFEDGSKEDITKEERITSQIKVLSPDGNLNYFGAEDEINGHGNSTWKLDKKSYTLHLQEKKPLCGMNASKKWVLLSNYCEGTRMACKMLYDLSGKIGMEYYPHSEWLDLYINGEYLGNYLLCEKIEVAEERVNIKNLEKVNQSVYNSEVLEEYTQDDDSYKGYLMVHNPDNISGGYLIEKDLPRYQEWEHCGFYTDRDICFTVNSPQNASVEEVQYIRDFVQKVDEMIVGENASLFEYIDVPSFNRRFFIEELCLDYDGFVTSCYFYKKANEDKLYAGPVWDYDMSFGEINGAYLQYNYSVLNTVDIRETDYMLDWDSRLHENDAYKVKLSETYREVYPVLKECLYEDIDAYADKIRTSVILDNIRWESNEDGHYASFDNNVRYIKFFMRSRMNMMNERYGIDEVLNADDLTEEIHTIRCFYEGQLYEFQVKDGDFFMEADLPPFDNDKYSGWKYERDDHFFCELLPVFEDVILLPNERG